MADRINFSGDGGLAGQLEVLREIAGVLARTAVDSEALRLILRLLEVRLGMFNGVIMLSNADDDELLIETLGGGVDANPGDARYRRGEGMVGGVFASGKSVVIPRVADEPKFKMRIYARSSWDAANTSFICVPIVLGNETVGTLSAGMPRRDMRELRDAERFMEIVAGIIAHDVHGRRLARMERLALENENERLRNELRQQFRPDNMVGGSTPMREVFGRIRQVAAADTTVLIRGESGTGKELVAAAIHYNSPRAGKPLVKVNCAALSPNLIESELFGHERGAFTGASQARVGRVEEAEGGTLFLDEIGEFPQAIQVKFLRFLQEREFERVGSNRTIAVNLRVIAATNRDLEKAVADGNFRGDLYYRVNVFPIHLPPLRQRKDDILQLANHFVEKYAAAMGKEVKRISTPAINMLVAYHWPGNVRELENCVEHAVLLCEDGVVRGRDLPPTLQMPEEPAGGGASAGGLTRRVDALERELIVDALKRSGGNISAAARELGVTGRIARYKIDTLGIPRELARIRV